MTQLEQKFVHAIAFCLVCGKPDGDLDAANRAARWAMGHDVPEPQDPTQQVALVSGGATKIKGYVFESARLPEIRGASGLLERINLEDMRQKGDPM